MDDESALLAVNAIIFTFKLLLVSNEPINLEINVFLLFSAFCPHISVCDWLDGYVLGVIGVFECKLR